MKKNKYFDRLRQLYYPIYLFCTDHVSTEESISQIGKFLYDMSLIGELHRNQVQKDLNYIWNNGVMKSPSRSYVLFRQIRQYDGGHWYYMVIDTKTINIPNHIIAELKGAARYRSG